MAEETSVPRKVVQDAWRTKMERGVRGNGFSGYGEFEYKPSSDRRDNPRERTYQM